jgi:hypothetical protein
MGLKANADGSGAIQVGGSDAITITSGLAVSFPTGNLSFNSGYGSSAVAYGCRAWVNFNGTGTPAIRASGNVTSLTDNGTGDYTVNFTTAMPDTSYAVFSTAQRGDSVAGGIIGQVQGTTANAYTSITTTSVRIRTINVTETTIDSLYVGVSVFR